MIISAILTLLILMLICNRSYTWDLPQKDDKVLKIEFAQGQHMKGIRLDIDEVSKLRSLILMRPLPGLGNPLAEGSLMRRGQDKDEWIPTYCILKADVFYMFRDETRSDLIGIVNLSRHTESGLEMASVKKSETKGIRIIFITNINANAFYNLRMGCHEYN